MRVWPLKDTGGVMDIQKERKAFEKALVDKCGFNPESSFSVDDKGEYKSDATHFGWAMWQAAKAQAVPEGFVLVKNVHPDAIVHNQGLGLFQECQIIYGWDGKSKDFKDALNKGFYHGVKLGAKAVLETTMIKAQEQSHD